MSAFARSTTPVLFVGTAKAVHPRTVSPDRSGIE
jgi:hypothetical protein